MVYGFPCDGIGDFFLVRHDVVHHQLYLIRGQSGHDQGDFNLPSAYFDPHSVLGRDFPVWKLEFPEPTTALPRPVRAESVTGIVGIAAFGVLFRLAVGPDVIIPGGLRVFPEKP